MKTIVSILGVAIMLSGWAVAALCLNVVRTPDPNDSTKSKLVVLPKARLGIDETYVDARHWTAADALDHAALVGRMLDAGKAEQLKFLANPKSKQDVQSQLTDLLAGAKGQSPRSDALGGSLDIDISF